MKKEIQTKLWAKERKFWEMKPATKAHSSLKGKRGYSRKCNKWKKEI